MSLRRATATLNARAEHRCAAHGQTAWDRAVVPWSRSQRLRQSDSGDDEGRDEALGVTRVFTVARCRHPALSLSELKAVETTAFQVLRQLPGAGSITLEGEQAGDGPPVVLLHGLSATRRNVVQGSRALVKRGYRLISYDARGHGSSSPAPRYEYADLVADLEAVLDAPRAGADGARGELDGRSHRHGVHARAPRAGAGTGAGHARLHGLCADGRRRWRGLGAARRRPERRH